MVNASLEIGFILAAMPVEDGKPSTAFLFPFSASNKGKTTPAKETSIEGGEQPRYSTDSESCLKGMNILLSASQSAWWWLAGQST